MVSIGMGNGVKDVLHKFDELNWHSWWQTVCELERAISQDTPPSVELEDRRDAIAVETLNLSLDLDEEWMLYRMKSWVRDLETRIRERF